MWFHVISCELDIEKKISWLPYKIVRKIHRHFLNITFLFFKLSDRLKSSWNLQHILWSWISIVNIYCKTLENQQKSSSKNILNEFLDISVNFSRLEDFVKYAQAFNHQNKKTWEDRKIFSNKLKTQIDSSAWRDMSASLEGFFHQFSWVFPDILLEILAALNKLNFLNKLAIYHSICMIYERLIFSDV